MAMQLANIAMNLPVRPVTRLAVPQLSAVLDRRRARRAPVSARRLSRALAGLMADATASA